MTTSLGRLFAFLSCAGSIAACNPDLFATRHDLTPELPNFTTEAVLFNYQMPRIMEAALRACGPSQPQSVTWASGGVPELFRGCAVSTSPDIVRCTTSASCAAGATCNAEGNCAFAGGVLQYHPRYRPNTNLIRSRIDGLGPTSIACQTAVPCAPGNMCAAGVCRTPGGNLEDKYSPVVRANAKLFVALQMAQDKPLLPEFAIDETMYSGPRVPGACPAYARLRLSTPSITWGGSQSSWVSDPDDAQQMFRRSAYRLNLQMRYLTTATFSGTVTIGSCNNATGQPTIPPKTIPVSLSFTGLDMELLYKPRPNSARSAFLGELVTTPKLTGVDISIGSGGLSSTYKNLMNAAGFNQARVQFEVNKMARQALGDSLSGSAGPLLDDLFDSTVFNDTHDYFCSTYTHNSPDPIPPMFEVDARTAQYRCFTPSL